MILLGRPIALAAILFATATSAHAAASLTTPVVTSNLLGFVQNICQLINVSTKPVDVSVEIRDANSASLIASSGASTVNPGHVLTVYGNTDANTYCTAIGLSAKKGRLTYGHFTNNEPIVVVTAP